MRSMRTCVMCCFLVAAATVVTAPTIGLTATTRPHPLFGNSVLGSSAEVVTMWPTGSGGVNSLRIADFLQSIGQGLLVPKPPSACVGEPSTKYQQLDVVTGDLDGDGRDDIVAAYALPLHDWSQGLVLEIPTVGSGMGFTAAVTDTQPYDIAVERGAYRSPSNVRLAVGNFDADPVQKFVLGTRVQRNFRGTLDAGDLFGASVAAIGDVDGDGVGDLAAGVPDDDDGGTNRGAVWILFLRSDGTVRSQQKISDTQGGFAGVLDNSDHFGRGVAALGDHDGDGVPDIAVGAYGDDDGGADRGAVWLLHLNHDGTTNDFIKISDTTNTPLAFALDNGDYFGDGQMTSIGDFDGNGYGDLAVGATNDDDGGTDRGAVWLLFLKASGVDSCRKISNLTGLSNGDRLGFGLAYFPHFNIAGDKVLAVGAPFADANGNDAGKVFLLFLNSNGTVDSLRQIGPNLGTFGTDVKNDDRFGYSIAAMPDLNGQGGCDLAIGAPGTDADGSNYDKGCVWIVWSNSDGTYLDKLRIGAVRGSSTLEGGFTGSLYKADSFGGSVACPGDLDGDGLVDLVVGAFGADAAYDRSQWDFGDLWCIYLNSNQTVKGQMENGTWWDAMLQLQLMELDGSRHPVTLASTFVQHRRNDGSLTLSQPDDLKESTRFDVAAGDFDGDGIDEIVVGGVGRRADDNMELFVTIYAYEGGNLERRVTSSYGNQAPGNNANGEGVYFDHVAIATGHLRPALTDQILFSWSRRDAVWSLLSPCPPYDASWLLAHTTRAYLATLIVNSDSDPWAISDLDWGVDRKEVSISNDFVVESECLPSPPDPQFVGPSLGVAVGDLTGDGMDEVAWAALNKVYVYQLADGSLGNPRTFTDRAAGLPVPGWGNQDCVYNDPSRRVVGIADLDATTDADEWLPELVVQDWGATGHTQRIRVYQAATNPLGVITGLVQRWNTDPLYDTQVPMTEGDVALVCGDVDGDAVRLGTPSGPIPVTDVIQPLIFLGSPPVHFDVFDDGAFDLSGCFPGGAVYDCATDFQAFYERATAVAWACSTTVQSDWGLSTEIKGWAGGFGRKIEGRMKTTYGEHFSRSEGQAHSYGTSSYTPTSGDDRILADVMGYTLWEYPVLDGVGNVAGHLAVMEPGSAAPKKQWYTYDTWATEAGAQAPMLTHEPGNILSYPVNVPQTGDYGDLWKQSAEAWTVSWGTGPPQTFDLWWSDLSSTSSEEKWEAGVEVGATLTYEVGDPILDTKAGISVSVNGHYDASELTTHSVSVSEDIHLGVTLGYLGPAAHAPYSVLPYVYRSRTTGALVLDYEIKPEGTQNWWDRYRGLPDLTFMLPRLHSLEKGFPINPTTRYRSPDVRLMPNHVARGDTVTIRAVVRNYSLKDGDPGTKVRFFVGDPDGAHMPIQDIDGDFEFTIPVGIPAREKAPVTIRWVAPAWLPDTAWVYAQVDPDDDVAEVHEYNNKAYGLLHVTGGTVDAPAQVAGMPFRLEQSVPNPFRGSTMIAFALPERTRVELNVYDIAGRLMTTLVDEDLAPGRHEFRWDGRGRDGAAVRPGVYLCRIQAGAFGESRRLVRLN